MCQTLIYSSFDSDFIHYSFLQKETILHLTNEYFPGSHLHGTIGMCFEH